MSAPLGCGACNLCCRLLEIKDMGKPAQMQCWHTGIHGGCAVHAQKETDPILRACFQFKCVWLESQTLDDLTKRGTRSMRPDQIHVLFGPFDREDPTLLYVHVDPAHKTAWRNPAVLEYMDEVRRKGGKLCVVVGDHHFMYESMDEAAAA